jgi:hypothetical protein
MSGRPGYGRFVNRTWDWLLSKDHLMSMAKYYSLWTMFRLGLCLVALALVSGLGRGVPAAVPEICRVQGGNTKTIWGVGFAPGQTEVRDWKAPFDADAALAALRTTPYDAGRWLPAEPPSGSRRVQVLDADPRGLVLAVESESHYNASGFYDARAGGHVCWIKNSDGWSKPWRITTARPWWVSPAAAPPGATVRVFGRSLDAQLVALKASDDGQVTVLSDFQRGQHPLYETQVTLPADLAPGPYELYVHNGTGGESGWGGPVSVCVEAAAEAPTRLFDAREFGAKGNGVEDDTAALRAALVQAGEAGGGSVFLPPGRYAISATLWIPTGVTLQGAGAQNSLLAVRDERPMQWDVPAEIAREIPGHFRARQQDGGRGAMLWMRDRSRVADLGLVDGPGTLLPIFGSRDRCRVERCHIRATHSTQPAVMIEWGSDGFVLKDSQIEAAAGGVFLVHGPHTQALISGNTIRNLRPGQANNLFIRAFVHSIIELWAWKDDAPSPVAFCDLIGVRIMGRGNISLLGPLVFGNTVRFSEVTGFRYGPGFHIQPTWLQGADPQQRAAVDLQPAGHKIAGLPQTAPLKDWNIVEGSHLVDGPRGIRISPQARHTQLRNNAIHVDGQPVVDESAGR